MLELGLEVISSRQLQSVTPSLADQSSREHQHFHAKTLQSLVAVPPGQAGTLEVVSEVERQQEELKECDVRNPLLGWHLGQGIVVGQLSDVPFDPGTRRVEPVDPPRADLQIGDEDVVGVPLVLEELELLGLDRVFGDGPAHDHKPMLLAFAPRHRPVPELPDLPAVGHPGEAAVLRLGLDGPALDRDDNVSVAFLVEKFDHAPAEKARVDAEADTGAGDMFRDLGQADLDKRLRSSRGSGIPRTQRAVPELLEAGLEGQQGVVGAASVLLGIVAHARPFDLPAIDYNHRRVDVEDHAGTLAGSIEEPLPKQFVDPCDLADVRGCQPLQKPSDCGLIWEVVQAHNFLKGAIVLEDLRLVDAVHARDDRVEDRQNHVGGLKIPKARTWPDVALEHTSQTQLLTKMLDQEHAGEVRQVRFFEGKRDFSQSFRHWTQSNLLGEFVSIAFCAASPRPLSTEARMYRCLTFSQIAHH